MNSLLYKHWLKAHYVQDTNALFPLSWQDVVGCLLQWPSKIPTSWYSHPCVTHSLWLWAGLNNKQNMQKWWDHWRLGYKILTCNSHILWFFSLAPMKQAAMLWAATRRNPHGKERRAPPLDSLIGTEFCQYHDNEFGSGCFPTWAFRWLQSQPTPWLHPVRDIEPKRPV